MKRKDIYEFMISFNIDKKGEIKTNKNIQMNKINGTTEDFVVGSITSNGHSIGFFIYIDEPNIDIAYKIAVSYVNKYIDIFNKLNNQNDKDEFMSSIKEMTKLIQTKNIVK